MRARTVLAGVAFLLLAGLSGRAAVTLEWAADGVTVGAGAAARYLGSMAPDGSGGAFVVYAPGPNGVRAQRLDASGGRLWGDQGAAVYDAAPSPEYPGVLGDGAGGCFVSWYDRRGDGNAHCFVQRLDGGGAAQWPFGGVVLAPGKPASSWGAPGMRLDGAGGVHVAWAGDGDIRVQHLGAGGNPLWVAGGAVACPFVGTGGGTFPQLAGDGAGGLFVSWWDHRSDSEGDVFVQRLDGDGTLHAGWPDSGVAVCQVAGFQSPPRIVEDGAGGAILAWQDVRNSTPDQPVWGQRIDGSGSLLWGPANGVQLTPPANSQDNVGNVFGMGLVTDGAGGVVLTWKQGSGDYNDTQILAQRFGPSGSALWNGGDPVAVCDAPGGQQDPRITADGAGGAFIVWTDQRDGDVMNYSEDVYGQHVDASGALLWGASGEGFAICAPPGASSLQSDPQVVPDGAGGAIVAWTDWRGDWTSDTRAQRVTGSEPPGPVAVRQYVLPNRIVRTVDEKRPSRNLLTFTGQLDTGPEAAALDGPLTFRIGAFERQVPAPVADGRGVLHARDSVLDVTIVPGPGGSSRCTLTAKVKGPDVAAIPSNARLDFSVTCGDVKAPGGCEIKGGRYVRGGGLPPGTTLLASARAKLVGKDSGKDSFAVQFVMTPGPRPDIGGNIVFGFGDVYFAAIPVERFKGHGGTSTFHDPKHVLPSMTVNFRKGLITVTGTKARLGPFVAGAQPVRFTVGPEEEPAVIDVRMVLKGTSLKY